MPYVGNQAADRFVSQPAVDHFSGDGSTTAFTLSFPVTSDQDILVSVDGVVQDTAAYAVSSGTTLTFTAAPSSNSGNNIFVNYLARTHATVAHPATSALTATTGTFTDDLTVDTNTLKVDSTNNRVGIGTASPLSDLHQDIALSDREGHHLYYGTDAKAAFTVLPNTGEIRIGAATTGTSGNYFLELVTRNGSTLNTVLSSTKDGEITKPLQPSFLVQPNSTQNNIGDTAGTATVITMDNERYDVGGNFASNAFTAPVTGKYLLSTVIYVSNLDSAATYVAVYIYSSNRIYFQIFDPDFGQDSPYWTFTLSTVADMDANDTVNVRWAQYQGTVQTDINAESSFSGILIG